MADPRSWRGRGARVFSMPPQELADRLRQFVSARADLLRYRGQDVLSARALEGAGSNGHFFFAPAETSRLIAELRRTFPAQANEIILRAEKICCHHFDLLGYENLDYGAEIDWHLDPVHHKRAPRKPWFKVKYLDFEEVGDSKVTWELNRHQHFVTLAKAYWLTGNEAFVREILAEWTSWHHQNPYPIGINWASSLEVAFRGLSWVWTYFLLQECALFTTELRGQWQAALSLHGRHLETYLSTYFSPNTHLLGEALAMFSLGILFPGWQSAARWRRRGWEILEREAAKQVREDGFYFEQSTYYHVYALDTFLHARILAALNGISVSPEFEKNLERMLNALLLLGRAGIPLSIGDDDGGRLFDPRRNRAEHMMDPLATGAVLYRRGDWKFSADSPREETLWLLGLKGLAEFDSLPATEPTGATTALVDSGIYLMAEESSGQQLQIDAGPMGAGSGGHGHADAMSIGLVREGRHLLLDPGTFEYVGDTDERARLRGTGAHNTLRVDGRDQAEATGPFSWENLPHVTVEQWITGGQFNLFRGSHDGYCRLPSPVTHRRWVFHGKGLFWLVRDVAEGHGSHQLELAWHLGPTLLPATSQQPLFSDGRDSLALLTAKACGWSESVTREYWSPVYGKEERATVVTFGAQVQLPADFATLVISNENAQLNLGRFVKMNEFAPHTPCGYRYSNSRQEHEFVFTERPSPWKLEAWASDAEFLWWGFDGAKEKYTLVMCNGSYADAGGRRVLTCGKMVSYAEVVNSAGKIELGSSDPEQVVLEQSLDRVWADRSLILLENDRKRMGV
jgi:hypothetical protein